MLEGAPAAFLALEQSSFAATVRQSPWAYPAANVGHIVSLVVLAGAVTIMPIAVRVVSEQAFAAWVEDAKKKYAATENSLVNFAAAQVMPR